MATVGVALDTFDDGCELDVACTYFFIEVVDLEGVVCIEIIDDSHGVPFHPVFIESIKRVH